MLLFDLEYVPFGDSALSLDKVLSLSGSSIRACWSEDGFVAVIVPDFFVVGRFGFLLLSIDQSKALIDRIMGICSLAMEWNVRSITGKPLHSLSSSFLRAADFRRSGRQGKGAEGIVNTSTCMGSTVCNFDGNEYNEKLVKMF